MTMAPVPRRGSKTSSRTVHRLIKGLFATLLALAVMLAGGLLVRAEAATTAREYRVKIEQESSLNVRLGSGTGWDAIGKLGKDDLVRLICFERGDDGAVWDLIEASAAGFSGTGYVADRYIFTGTNEPVVPPCDRELDGDEATFDTSAYKFREVGWEQYREDEQRFKQYHADRQRIDSAVAILEGLTDQACAPTGVDPTIINPGTSEEELERLRETFKDDAWEKRLKKLDKGGSWLDVLEAYLEYRQVHECTVQTLAYRQAVDEQWTIYRGNPEQVTIEYFDWTFKGEEGESRALWAYKQAYPDALVWRPKDGLPYECREHMQWCREQTGGESPGNFTTIDTAPIYDHRHPDIVVAAGGKILLVEVKANTSKYEPDQKAKDQEIRRRYGWETEVYHVFVEDYVLSR